jgi:sugar phosphate isomerase/epimerase
VATRGQDIKGTPALASSGCNFGELLNRGEEDVNKSIAQQDHMLSSPAHRDQNRFGQPHWGPSQERLESRRTFLQRLSQLAALYSIGGLSGSSVQAVPLGRFKLGIINDEVSYDLEDALRFLKSYGLSWIELRELWQEDHYITALNKKELRRVKDLLEKYQIKVSVIATYIYKCQLPGSQLGITPDRNYYKYSQQNDVLKRAIEIGHFLDCRSLRVFSFWRTRHPQAVYRQVVDHLERAIESGQKAGVRILLENETNCNVGTGAELKRIAAEIPSEFFGVNWDPGNAFALNELPYPDGYEQLPADRIFHCHLKDIRANTGSQEHPWLPIGKGDIDFLGQLRALDKAGYQGTLSLETHYVPPGGTAEDGSRESMKGLLEVITKV